MTPIPETFEFAPPPTGYGIAEATDPEQIPAFSFLPSAPQIAAELNSKAFLRDSVLAIRTHFFAALCDTLGLLRGTLRQVGYGCQTADCRLQHLQSSLAIRVTNTEARR